MSDLISRQAVKDLLRTEWVKLFPVELDPYLSLALQDIDELPSAQEWIPVTERLPLLPELHKKPYYVDFESELYDSDWVLVCCYVRKEPVYVVSQIIYDAKCDTYEWTNLYDYAECDIDDGAVVAWMPLPEPYREVME